MLAAWFSFTQSLFAFGLFGAFITLMLWISVSLNLDRVIQALGSFLGFLSLVGLILIFVWLLLTVVALAAFLWVSL